MYMATQTTEVQPYPSWTWNTTTGVIWIPPVANILQMWTTL